MTEIEIAIQKNICNVLEYVPKHISEWEDVRKKINSLLPILISQSEEYIHVERVICNDDLPNFENLRYRLKLVILKDFDRTSHEIYQEIERLKQVNPTMKNRVKKLENSVKDLDWDLLSKTRDGTPFQPALKNLLQFCSKYTTFFSELSETIFHTFENINQSKRDTIQEFQQSLEFSLTGYDVNILNALHEKVLAA